MNIKEVGKTVMLVDSKAAIMAMTSSDQAESCAIERCRNLLESEKHLGWDLFLQWIPSHCDIEGNKIADELAKLGSILLLSIDSISYKNVCRQTNKRIK